MNRGEIAWVKGYGYTSADSTRLVDENTLFQAASISKPVAAMAALALVEEGKIGLDEDVNLYLQGWQVEENKFTEQEKVTLRRILSHSAGLTVHGFGGYASGEDVPKTVQVLDGEDPANSGRIYPDTLPGVQYRYSGGGYTVMQKILCDITGKAFPELMSEILRSFSEAYSWNRYKPELKSLAPLEMEELESLTGQYMLRYDNQELIVEISLQEKHLKGVQLWNDFPFEVYPESATRFFNKDDGTEFEFSKDEQDEVSAITIYEGGQEYIFKKI